MIIDWDLEDTPLEIKTNSELGSNKHVSLYFYSEGGATAGGVRLKFSTTLQYGLLYCTKSSSNLPTTPPSSVDKIWRITLNRDSGIRVKIACNGVKVLNMLVSESTCETVTGGFTGTETWRRLSSIPLTKHQTDTDQVQNT